MTINLIPPQSKKERRAKQTMAGFYISLTAILLFLLIISGLIYLTNSYVLSDLTGYDQKMTEKTEQISKYKNLESQIRQTNLKLDVLKKTDSDRIIWSEIFDELAGSTPTKVQISSLSTDKTTKKVSLSGTAETRKEIADMKDQLELSPIFKNVTFSSSTYNADKQTYSFSLDSELEGLWPVWINFGKKIFSG